MDSVTTTNEVDAVGVAALKPYIDLLPNSIY